MNRKDYNLKLNCILLFAFLLAGNLTAQIKIEPKGDNGTKTIPCGSTTTFTDDNTIDGVLYEDNENRNDRIILCPSSPSKILSITFSKFSVAAGDILEVYDGDLSKGAAPLIDAMSGNGVSNANGGWLKASCDKTTNSTGCLTFIFKTNDDLIKSTGWVANVSCEDNTIQIQCANNVSAKDNCRNPSTAIPVTFTAPTFTACNGTVNLMITLTGCAAAGFPKTVTSGQTVTCNFPLGTHPITATLVGDPTKTCTFIVAVDQGSIVCNDNVNASIQMIVMDL